MARKGKKISVFGYRDYRKFLNDWFKSAKERNSAYSYRSFSKNAGFSSSNFFMLVMQGKRNLTEESIKKISIGLKLNKQEDEFFRNLVFYSQALRHEDKDFYYKKLLQSREYRKLQPIEKDHYEYYSAWYHPVVRELVASKDFDGTPEWIAKRIFPAITTSQAAVSIKLLESLGFIKRNGDGRWEQTNTIVSTGPELVSHIVHNYHKSLLDLSKVMMDNVSTQDRDISALTLGVKKERLGEIKSKIVEFRREILELVSGDSEPEDVVQLNMQLFPLTKGKGRGRGHL